MKKATVIELATAKLQSSGLTLDDATQLGIKVLGPDATKVLFPKFAVPALHLVYHDARGCARADTCRVRLLVEPPPGAFGAVPTKPVRYLQPSGSPPAAYLPRTVPWAAVQMDPSLTVVLTEGELKAACAAKHGFKCVGLGGVSSWQSSARGWRLLPELEAFVWGRRDVVLCFDSDAATNPVVSAALGALVAELTRRGAFPRVAQLPAVAGLAKTGLDDFVVACGASALRDVLDAAPADELARKLWQFNARFAYVLDPGFIYDEQEDQRHKPQDFRSAAFANVWARTGGQAPRTVQVAKAWLEWPCRRQSRSVTFEPAGPRFTVDGRLNTWSGWGCEPRAGSVAPWQELLALLFAGADPADARWFERWCLYPIAHPGVKQLSAVGIWSLGTGQGKSLVGSTLGQVYGPAHHSVISQRELESPFNGWAVNKQFIMIDDISAHDSRAKADVLKKLITQEQLLVNVKFLPTYAIPDCANYYLTSNRANALYVEDQDRRFFIHEVTASAAPPAFYATYVRWLRGEGPGALLRYARELDFAGYEPSARPPVTKAKQEMVESAKSELALWLTELRDDPDGRLTIGRLMLTRDLFTPSELIAFFDQTRRGKPVTANVMGLFLKEYFSPAAGGSTLKPHATSERFYVIRNQERWLNASRAELLAHIREHRARERGGTGKF